MSRSMVGRADLARALATNDMELVSHLGDLLGFEQAIVESVKPAPARQVSVSSVEARVVTLWPDGMVDMPFWRVTRFDARERLRRIAVPTDKPARLHWSNAPGDESGFVPMAPWKVIGARLRKGLADWRKSREVDVPQLVGRLARGQCLHDVPRRSLRRWGNRIQVVLDRSDRLVPYWLDQEMVVGCLRRLLPEASLEICAGADPKDLISFTPSGDAVDFRVQAASTVLVLGDLGTLDVHNRNLTRRWLQWGGRLRDAGCHRLALVPCCEAQFSGPMRRLFRVVSWQRNRRTSLPRQLRKRMLDRLMAMLSPALRIEPGLLRAVRRLLPDAVDVSLEAGVWQHQAVTSQHCTAASLDRDYAAENLLPAFEDEPEHVRRAVLKHIRARRAGMPEVWFEELLGLTDRSRRLVPREDLEDAYACARFLADVVRQPHRDDHDAAIAYSRRATDRLPDPAWEDPEVGATLRGLWRDTHRSGTPPRFDPAELDPGDAIVSRQLLQVGPELRISAGMENGSPLATVRTTNQWVVVDSVDQFWKLGKPPRWATDWGQDQHGRWVDVSVPGARGTVTQRLRWIPPGMFRMGSPESEPKRYDDEGPQHEVTITRGFWIFDTAVTQELWQAVMGGNPSRFTSPRRPVERVSWDDCQEFLQRLTALLNEAPFDLPTEAQWEYACRAGTTTPFSFGNNITPEQVNYDGNYPYADGMKGLYRQETVDVGSLPANAWGLHEMHGNVNEWCRDGRRDYAAQSAIDPEGATEGAAAQMVRGGCWCNFAQNVRSAYRNAYEPGFRSLHLGFRCALVQGEAEPRPDEKHRGEASRIVVRFDEDPACDLPSVPRLRLLTDLDELELERFTKPTWASAIGRDQYGLWSEFTVENPKSSEDVTQRMRWIPPGRFPMGSPDDEPGRFDDEGPQHEAVVTHGFWLFDTPVTQALWTAITKSNPSRFPGATRPVERVSWHDCQSFMQRLARRIDGLALVLPTEAEWEYACRAGTQTPCSFGDSITSSDARYYESEGSGTTGVASYAANAWGLYDMYGNVWEWCFDGKRQYEESMAVDPVGATDESASRVVRGGGWYDYAQYVRSASRYPVERGDRDNGLGFRCALVQDPAGRRSSEASEGPGVATEKQPGRSN